jgi:hypothetical protein
VAEPFDDEGHDTHGDWVGPILFGQTGSGEDVEQRAFKFRTHFEDPGRGRIRSSGHDLIDDLALETDWLRISGLLNARLGTTGRRRGLNDALWPEILSQEIRNIACGETNSRLRALDPRKCDSQRSHTKVLRPLEQEN